MNWENEEVPFLCEKTNLLVSKMCGKAFKEQEKVISLHGNVI